jgi:hypothetical protein
MSSKEGVLDFVLHPPDPAAPPDLFATNDLLG